eukprot:13791064-Heterocapsa_arctica.AAC.1
MQTFNYDSDEEQNKSTISLLWCNINQWGAQPNHYDLLHPIQEEANKEKSFKYTFIENHDALIHKCNIEANFISQYIGRSAKDEVERGTTINTLTVSGSLMDFEWILENTEDHIVLIQEHCILPNEIGSWKSAAFRKGWTGVWHPAINTQKTVDGRPGNLEEWPYWSGMAEQS